jgi:large subunit ribosomal protein L10
LEAKQAVVAEVGRHLAQAQAVIVAEYRGLNVGEMTALHAKAREVDAYLKVVKNTLARRAVKETPFAELASYFVGPVTLAIARDPVGLARALHEFSKGNEKFVIKVGALAHQVISAKEVARLANLPGRNELLAKLMGTLQAPAIQLVRTLHAVPASLVRVLAALRDRRAREEHTA